MLRAFSPSWFRWMFSLPRLHYFLSFRSGAFFGVVVPERMKKG